MDDESAHHLLKLEMRNYTKIKNETIIAEYLSNSALSYNASFDFINIHKQNLSWFTSKYYTVLEDRSETTEWKVLFLIGYLLVAVVSLLGNSIVCQIVFSNSTMRSTTNIYLGSLSVSDLLMTVLNIPLQLTKHFSRDWPLNRFFCKCMPFFQGLSVNVSSFTIACIALDRYQVVAYPLKPRPRMTTIMRNLALIWIMAALASAPNTVIADVEELFTYRKIIRCSFTYPEPKTRTRLILTVLNMTVQYLGPLSIAVFTYCKICFIIWNRQSIGIMSERQRNQRYAAKWKTIKMLIVVLLVFAICWFPFNTYHLYQDLRGDVGQRKHNSWTVLFCHLVAMSSICFNPFVYCWLNEKFREKAKNYLLCKCLNPRSWMHTKSSSHHMIHKLSSKAPSLSTSTQSKYSYRYNITQIYSSSKTRDERKTNVQKSPINVIENI